MNTSPSQDILFVVQQLQNKNFSVAESACKNIIKIYPDDQRAQELLAIIYIEQKKISDAIKLYENLLNKNPDNISALNNIATIFLNEKKFSNSIYYYKEALALKKNYLEAIFGLGLALYHSSDFIEAKKQFKKAIELDRTNPSFFWNLGNCCYKMKDFDEALNYYQKSLKLNSNFFANLNNIGLCHLNLGNSNQAVEYFKMSIRHNPNDFDVHNNLGLAYLRNNDFNNSLIYFSKSLELNPISSNTLNNLARLYLSKNDKANTLNTLFKVIEIEPNNPTSHLLLARAYASIDKTKALDYFKKAIDLDHNLLEAIHLLSNLQKSLGDLSSAYSNLKDLISKNPLEEPCALSSFIECLLSMGAWDELPEVLADTLSLARSNKIVFNPFTSQLCFNEQSLIFEITKKYSKESFGSIQRNIFSCYGRERTKIAYFSSDLRDGHPVGRLFVNIFELHDRQKFEVHVFSLSKNSNQDDPIYKRIINSVDFFHHVDHLDDVEINNLAKNCNIDIAIDLNGYTEGHRTNIFNLGCAPIQVSYLGYPGSLALNSYDYLIADKIIIPDVYRKYYSENVAYLDNYQPNNNSRAPIKRFFSRGDLNLPDDAFIFCCFNNSVKMNPDIFSIWLEILTSVNNSYLWIPLNNEIFQKNIRSFAQNLGVNPDRIIFADRLDSHEQHLSRYLCADLFLDTFPYGAHTTANDALWANLPVITVAGSTFASRECASILNGVGLNQLITDNLSDYKKLAIRLAHDKKFLGEFKDHLTFNKSSHRLFNNHLTVSNLEKLFNQMVEINLSGKAAHDIFC